MQRDNWAIPLVSRAIRPKQFQTVDFYMSINEIFLTIKVEVVSYLVKGMRMWNLGKPHDGHLFGGSFSRLRSNKTLLLS